MIPVVVEVRTSRRLTRAEQKLIELPNRLGRLRQFTQKTLAPEAQKMVLKHWRTKGSAYGHKWAPWAEETLRKRLLKGNVDKGILRDSDTLFNSLTKPQAIKLEYLPNGVRLSLNTGVPYSIFHQMGTRYMPARLVLPMPLPPTFVRTIRKLTVSFIKTGQM
jgi:hypothetical protein